MKKYNLKKIMNDAWRMMRANRVGGVYQISFSYALRFAWEIARKDLRKAEYAEKIVLSGKYDYIVKEENLTNRYYLVRRAFSALRDEGNKYIAAFRKGLVSAAERSEYITIKNSAEHDLLMALRNSCKEKTSRPVWNDPWPYALGPLPEEEF